MVSVMMNLYYRTTELLGREYETEVEYEYEPEEEATPTSPPFPARVRIDSVRLMTRKVDGTWSFLDIESRLDSSQKRVLQAEILDYVPRLGFPRPVSRRRSWIIDDEREAA
jgi:hypothetical protein